jgi:hypothetical protein
LVAAVHSARSHAPAWECSDGRSSVPLRAAKAAAAIWMLMENNKKLVDPVKCIKGSRKCDKFQEKKFSGGNRHEQPCVTQKRKLTRKVQIFNMKVILFPQNQ